MDKMVYSGTLSYLHRKYKHYFRSSKWKVTKCKEWPDGKYTYVFEYCGKD